MKKRVLCIVLALLMVFPLVFAAFADTGTGSRDRGSVSLSKMSDGETLVKETPAAKETPGASDPAEQPEEIEPAEQPEEIEEPEIVEPIDEPEEIDEPEIVPEDVEEPEEPDEPEGEAPVDDIWDQIGALEENLSNTGKRGAPSTEIQKLTAADFAALTDNVQETVLNWDGYVDGSLVRNGDVLFWEGEDGIPYGYFPDAREKLYNVQLTASTGNDHNRPRVLCYDGQNETEIPANQISSIEFNENDVAVFGPLYHIDEGFADEDEDGLYDFFGIKYGDSYYVQGQKIANKINAINTVMHGASYCNFTKNMAHCYVFTQSAASVDMIAQALLKCRVVFIDTHGITDYFNKGADGVYDRTSKANTSYIMLTSGNSILDYGWHTGAHDGMNGDKQYRHAYAGKIPDGTDVWCVDGTTIREAADALNWPLEGTTNNDPFVWLGNCYGMATEGLCNPLLAMGAGVVYGYTKAVTFKYDAKCEHHFWKAMLENNAANVRGSAQTMKNEAGEWDIYKNDDFYDPDGNPSEVSPAHPWFASYDQVYPNYRLLDGADQGSVMSTWQIVQDMWMYPDPTDDPASFIPENPIAPEDAEYRTSYYCNTNYFDLNLQYLDFYRFEWDSSGDKAYALYLYRDDIITLKTDIDNGYDSYYGLDEGYSCGCKVEAAIVQEGNLKYAVVPSWKSPSGEDRVSSITRAEYYRYTPSMYEKGWFFDHWRFKNRSGSDPDAWAVYYNKWTGEEKPYFAPYTTLGGYKVVRAQDTPDGVKRSTQPVYDETNSPAGHYWIYDGVDWDTGNFDSVTGTGAKATFKFHCEHGCGYTEENPKTVTVDAVATGRNDISDTVYEVTFEASLDCQDRDSALDHWDHYESTAIRFGSEPETPPEPHVHEWGGPTYNWVQNGNAWECRATRVCLGDSSHVETETATATGKLTASATCTTKGKTTYTATFTNPAFTTQTKTVEDIPALGHDWIFDGFYTGYNERYSGDEFIGGFYSEEERTPWKGGGTAAPYYHCSRCDGGPDGEWFEDWFGRCAADGDGGVSTLNSGHPYDAPLRIAGVGAVHSLDGQYHHAQGVCGQSPEWVFVDFEWDPDDPEKAYAVYRYEEGIYDGYCKVSPSVSEPPLFIEVAEYSIAGDYSYYEIKVLVNASKDDSVTETETYQATIAAAQSPDGKQHYGTNALAHVHEWGEPTYEWASDNSTVTATRVCNYDASHVETETVNTTSEITTPATCEGKGKTTYTATFTNPAFETQTKTVENVPALGHDWYIDEWHDKDGDVLYWECLGNDGNPTAKAIFHCLRCNATEEVGPVPMTREWDPNDPETDIYCHRYAATVTGPDNESYMHKHYFTEKYCPWASKDHVWNIQWTWSRTEAKATAVFDCRGCDVYHEYDMNDIVVTREAGEKCHFYKASITLNGVEYTDEHEYMFDEDHEWSFQTFSYNWNTREVKAVYICNGLDCYEPGEANAELKHGSGAECHKYWGYISAEASLDHAEHDGYTQRRTKVFEDDHEWVYDGITWNTDGAVPTAKAAFHCKGKDNCGHDNDEVEVAVERINSRKYKATFTGLDGIVHVEYYTVNYNDLTIIPKREKVTKPGLPPIKPIIPIPGPPVKPAVR